ncbi:hypothetical protein FNZ56_09685 [Pseudoluteimonas lycopersici]|uniref:Uncharacterized protein n=1 Tax=Pseudoluteimonas lycopersici TaxID=1324796 RepID=A0A516V6K3_9GAMM|nr:hypothetical protein [Lysobacter lycopersici]QDQ74131.1 hypothetical protein FNZ56_09685 [Lysobacter lycopersici]
MPNRLAITFAALLALLPFAASADQFAYLDLKQAMAALDALDRSPREVQAFCAPCGDARATAIEVHDLGIARVWDDRANARPYADGEGRTYWEIELDGTGIDLAYIYVQTPAGWENIALKLGLGATDVPRTLSPKQLPR